MIRELFTNIKPKREYYMLVAVALLTLAAGAELAQSLPSRISEPSNQDHTGLAVQPMGNEQSADTTSIRVQPQENIRPADEYSAQLDLLRQKARAVSRFGDASIYDIQLEELSRQGRAASSANRLPVTANDYAYYLDKLRSLGQKAEAVNIKPVDANSFSAYLDQLRHMASEAQVIGAQEGK